MTVRAFFQAAKVAGAVSPYDTIHLKIFYPAQPSGSASEQDTGIVSADEGRSPFPVAIFFNGINCGAELYQWLAVSLAERGIVTVTFWWVAENIPGAIALTPGVDLRMLAPDTYGSAPTASALPTLLNVLEQVQAQGILAGLLDLQCIILGGHSAGGRVAIESASPQFFPQVVAAFAYGAHTAGALQAGYKPGTILPLPDALPLMLIGGTCDGVIANSSYRYGVDWEQPTTPVSRTFHEAIAGGRNDSYLLLVEGANHFSIAHPFDATTGRPFLDFPTSQPQEQVRSLLAEAIGLFVAAHVCQQSDARETLDRYLVSKHPFIALCDRK
ncbi:MAG: dienelactone hydrolase [Coleofasciculaceae cyanobacterium SM2_3_26]|nr:dienelactone hydrolase [Coleofasciculaceae cyanobacterium SM2_3_26]